MSMLGSEPTLSRYLRLEAAHPDMGGKAGPPARACVSTVHQVLGSLLSGICACHASDVFPIPRLRVTMIDCNSLLQGWEWVSSEEGSVEHAALTV